ncbi:MAG: 2-C-methyl-D-erythritol 4-phosphate cytidylyltransferase [Actinobacteria bacterium]|nr:2-C-methyl-D-erythritol 4-phosphate cytidylyltransferase [Actinomycetota bacterium]MDP6176497.1 2-C-methyl-D-erythritol 4-phosphate cytidylyltransferase [Acidimicrobiales bacterium]HJO99166.1 2-C-methyl-D-erythritol 4-phosphate cytidylyltransferase [Acidimicrobiales bacterium]
MSIRVFVMSVWTVVVAAGEGRRFGSDKQSADLGGVSVLGRSVATASAVSVGVVVVVGESRVEGARTLLAGVVGFVEVVSGGATRSASVRAGLAAVPRAAEVVLVHDGARPLATEAVYGRVIAAVRAGADAVVPVVAISDSLRSTSGGVVDREMVLAVQTPQGFGAAAIRAAHAGGADATDDATLVEASGGTVVVVTGETDNVKITRPVDLEVARCLLAEGFEDA